MKNLISILVLSVVAFANNGCQYKDEPYVITCTDGVVQWEAVPRFNWNLQNVGFDPSLQENWRKHLFLIINNELDYYHYIKAYDGYPKIDFKRKSMLIARVDKRLAYLQTQSVTMDCKTKKILWIRDTEEVRNGTGMIPESVMFSILIPKVDDKTTFVFDTNLIK